MGEDQEGTFYQIVCSMTSPVWTEVVSWLATQIGRQFPTGEVIEHIDHFQIIPLNATDANASAHYRAVAICSVYRPMKEEEWLPTGNVKM